MTGFVLPIFFAALILFSSGYARTTTRQGSFNSTIIIILAVLTIALVFIAILKTPVECYKKLLHPIKNKIYKSTDLYIVGVPIILFLAMLIYYYFTGNELFTLAHYVLLIIFGFSFAMVIPFRTFARYYNKTILFLGLFSVIVFIIMLFAGDTPFFSSTFMSGNEACYRSFLGLYFRIDVGNPRNYGPFWEPGIFSLMIIIAIVFELSLNKKPNFVNLIIYVVTIATTFSTSALLLLPFCIPLFFAFQKNKKWFWITLPLAIIFSGGIIILGEPSLNIPFFSQTFSKLFSSGNGSFKTRIFSPIYGVYLGGKSFGLGFGPNVFDAKYETLLLFGNTKGIEQTSTIGWIAGSFGMVGIFFLVAAYISMFYYFKNKYNIMSAIFILVYSTIIINCEPMYSFTIFWIIFMYPLAGEVKNFFKKCEDPTPLIDSVSKSKSTSSLTFTNLSWSLVIKVVALAIGLFIYPMYVKYFGNQTAIVDITGSPTTHGAIALGTWLVILQILSWVLMFDIGIGNGLKTKLVESFNKKDDETSKKLISSSYISNLLIVGGLLCVGLPIIFFIDFNSLLNISTDVIPVSTLQLAFALAFISICLEFVLKVILNIYQAMQKQVIASLFPLISTILLLIFVYFARFESMATALITISAFYIVSINLPLIILTIVCFSGKLKNCAPSFKYWSIKTAKSVVLLGGVYFLIQIFLLVINSTNKVIISNVFGPAMVTNYEPYLKIFSAICAVASAISLPIWTLTIRADVNKEYGWLKKAEKLIIVFIALFAVGSLMAAAVLQLVFNLWLKSNSFEINYANAFIFAVWAIASISSYFTSGISNGLKILKPQLIVYGIGSVTKIPLFFLIHHLIPNSDWSLLLMIDAAIMFSAAIIMAIMNHKAINARIASLPKATPKKVKKQANAQR